MSHTKGKLDFNVLSQFFLFPFTMHTFHHHWLDSLTRALAFLRSFCQLSSSIAKFL
jgi:hypothetical protein